MACPAIWAFCCLCAQPLQLQDNFDGAEISTEVWQLSIGGRNSFVRLTPRNGGKSLHLFGDHENTSLRTRQPIPNIAYTLKYDFLQPPDEADGYQAVVNHYRPEGHSYWWLEYGPGRFFLYTFAGGQWQNRWQAHGFSTNIWYHIHVRNTPTTVTISIFDESGAKLLAQSPSIPHDDGSAAPLTFAAVGIERGAWGMKIDNVSLSVTPVADRDDYRHRKNALEAAGACLQSDEARRLWPDGLNALQQAQTAFDAITRISPDDWPAYIAASQAFDNALRSLAEDYHARVLVPIAKQRGGWVMLDLWNHFDEAAALQGIEAPAPAPVAELSGIPFLTASFGRNCIWQDLPSRSQRAIALSAEAERVAFLLAPKYDRSLYSHDDSLADVLQVELRYADGFKERVVPVPADWQPPLPFGVGTPRFDEGRAAAYLVAPGHAAPLADVILCDAATQAGWAVFAMSYRPGLPREVHVLRALPQPQPLAKPAPATLTKTSAGHVIQNPSVRLVLHPRRGAITAFTSSYCKDLIPAGGRSPLFAVQLGDRLIYSDDFAVSSVEASNHKDGLHVQYRLRSSDATVPLEVTVVIAADSDGAWQWAATLKNVGRDPLSPRLIFPLLDGLDLGERPGWYFPQRGGAASDLPIEGLSSYGGMAWLQMVAAHRAEGGALYLRSDDTTGQYKILALRSSPDDQTKPHRVADIPKPAHAVDPWRSKTGVHLSLQYLPRELAPGATWSPPPATIAVHPGDWREALADYRSWLATWWHPSRPCPDRYKYGFYALVGGVPRDNQRGEEFGSYDWWHLNPFWSIDYPDELSGPIEELRVAAERAAQWGQAVGVYIEGMVMEKKRRIAREHGAEWAMMDDEANYYTYYSTEANPTLSLCPAVEAWQKWDAEAYAELARRLDLCAMYVDSTGSRWAELCYNPAHQHETPGIWPRGCAKLFEAIRQKVAEVNPDIAIHSEEPGCDYMALHEDGSWSHTLWTNLSGDSEYNPAGLNYFRFVLPQFKMYEIPSYRHALWRCKLAFFNGEGLWTNVPDVLRRELFIRWFPTLREHAETFLSNEVEPALRVVEPPVYINRFQRGPQAIYTVYNAGLRTRTAEIRLPLPTNGHVFDLLNLEEMSFAAKDDNAVLRLTLDPHEVSCFLITPRLFTARIGGDTLTVSMPSGTLGGQLVASLLDHNGVRHGTRPLADDTSHRQLSLDLRELFGPDAAGRILLRIAGPNATADETCLRWR